uniref:Uncharacterized protein n=1 Tax=Candidatus Kentrum sp. UNK TaxID=2126344 RepID=A0A451B6Y4_9GAMM|nr:MAG: hypothetical protein BECKUNK1418G_GA0071005_15011 [Candidatus Kentron sp. UNK]VFK74043.1 MAG: hypothetical protein BECKUNK1418H_GA0071006_14981 [Candidatus Kentron sp. UNK]
MGGIDPLAATGREWRKPLPYPIFVASFQYKHEAEAFMEALSGRLKQFGLSLAEKKTRCIEFAHSDERDRRFRSS